MGGLEVQCGTLPGIDPAEVTESPWRRTDPVWRVPPQLRGEPTNSRQSSLAECRQHLPATRREFRDRRRPRPPGSHERWDLRNSAAHTGPRVSSRLRSIRPRRETALRGSTKLNCYRRWTQVASAMAVSADATTGRDGRAGVVEGASRGVGFVATEKTW